MQPDGGAPRVIPDPIYALRHDCVKTEGEAGRLGDSRKERRVSDVTRACPPLSRRRGR
ncbi:MAG: hypothetical protein QOG45_2680 [Chloroflexota bacterium]|nr:hypothetical protein [Chloroflexota bacterium]